jgi:hypothetical protein
MLVIILKKKKNLRVEVRAGLTLAWQALYHFNHTLALLALLTFLDRISCFA